MAQPALATDRFPPSTSRVHPALITLGALGIVVVGLVTQFGAIRAHADQWTMWVMIGLGALAGLQAFVTGPSLPSPVIVSPTICFSFAVLLSWGLGPAIMAQGIAVVVTVTRVRHPMREAIVALAEYALAFAAAEVILRSGHPASFEHHATHIATDVLLLLSAVAAWLVVYSLAGAALIWAQDRSMSVLRAVYTTRSEVLVKAAMVMLSPILAIAAHMNLGYVILIFVPLYAVQRMAKLAAQREIATRTDPLTGLANRTGVKLIFTALTAQHRDPTVKVALLLADLDEFKHVNDALGHEVGDRLLIAVAGRLAKLRLPGGEIARLGGDEFAFIAPCVDATEAADLAALAVQALSEPIALDGIKVDVTASVGVAFHTDGDDFATLMRHADIAMYDAKRRGGGISAYEPSAHQDSLERLAILSDLRRALECRDTDEIQMYYQPQVCLVSGHVEGVEALLRWRHPTLGDVSTQVLIELAERSSVMHLLTMRVIDEVIAQVAAWTAEGIIFRTSINISSRDLYGDEVVTHLASRLAEYDVDPRRIQLEITESALLRDPSRVTGTVSRICSLGVAMSLDDFGTGYSSLQHLRRLPISEIKIDRSFVGSMAHNHDDAAIVRSTVEMARALGIRTVAEGVENEYTRQLLAEAGCTLAQGWLTAYPMPAAEVSRWLTRQTLAEEARPAADPRASRAF